MRVGRPTDYGLLNISLRIKRWTLTPTLSQKGRGSQGIALLFAAAALLAGCDQSGTNTTDTTPTDDDQTTNDQSAISDQDDEPGLSIAVDEDDGVFTQEIPIINANTITALRRQAALQNKVLVVDCWATWCPSCVAMFPHLHKAMKERGDDVMLISLTFDEGEALTEKAGQFLTKHDAWDNAYQATPDSDEKDAIAKALSDNWDGGALPAIFVYKPDGSTAHEMLETRGDLKDWVGEITEAVDGALSE